MLHHLSQSSQRVCYTRLLEVLHAKWQPGEIISRTRNRDNELARGNTKRLNIPVIAAVMVTVIGEGIIVAIFY